MTPELYPSVVLDYLKLILKQEGNGSSEHLAAADEIVARAKAAIEHSTLGPAFSEIFTQAFHMGIPPRAFAKQWLVELDAELEARGAYNAAR